ncbi:LacI family DNA-binding transcriptional regulator [Paenibacillus lutimineralis]|uniref:LacI family transcriptional regulator n=1 Tax=Paenibacillus lutimineralis TaxID=2707005 RepID=A0A3Q9IE59_9BACL|nr:LacI family DNA-binding transcriptional regulator [Paenibacillus lutimineralis]AZS17025.1 LacI family transcriptional regulator [Paenibacillus lutimineralis]
MGKKRITSHDVARLAGVSRSVVSAVLNATPGIGVSAETREKVLAAIHELDYHVDAQARSMKTGRSMTLAAFGDTRHPLFIRLLEGMQRECEARGYHILLCSPGYRQSGEARNELLDLYHQRKIDGIVTLDSTSYRSKEWATKVKAVGVPYVSVEGYAETAGVTSVLADYKGSVTMALEYLMKRNPNMETAPLYAEVYGAPAGRVIWAEKMRRNAYMDWCRKYSLSPEVSRHEEKEGRVNWLEWLEGVAKAGAGETLPPVLVNWSNAVPDLYRAAHSLGLHIGDELKIMAADNMIQGHRLSLPTLSCVEIPYVSMGEEAVRCVLGQIEEEQELSEKVWLPAILRPGESA